MAKKKRKHYIKLNNRVREFFGNIPFDEGVLTLSDDELLELALLLDLSDSSLDREASIKALRRVWSEGDYLYRKAIMDHLTGRMSISTDQNRKVLQDYDKVEKLSLIISEFDCTREEEQLLLESFLEAKASKVTKEKIYNKLKYMRVQRRLEIFESELNLKFDSINRMEFYTSYSFDFPKYTFQKTLVTYSDSVDIAKLLAKDDNEAISWLEGVKTKYINIKSNEIFEFLSKLDTNRYLSMDVAYDTIKQMPIDSDLYHIPIDEKVIESIIKEINPNYYLTQSEEHIIIQKQKSAKLFDVEIPYSVSVAYDKILIYSLIWASHELPIAGDLHSLNVTMLSRYDNTVNEQLKELRDVSLGLDIDDEVLKKHIKQFMQAQLISSGNLKVKEKTRRRILYHFDEYIKPLKEKRMREELLAKTIRDFKNLFPLARSLKRKITFHVGPTNSGKTYTAMNRLKQATTGYYLAPLRLLAMEGCEDMQSSGVSASLITGEEELIYEDSTHISSTIEMLSLDIDVDICVIDEIQMINDRDRGWAWANALIGAPARELILTGSIDALKAVTEVVEYLGEELNVIYFERKNPLEMIKHPTLIKDIEPKSAVVAFSRKEVLSYKQRLSSMYKVSVIYGNLSPEVRREEARKFREGETDILVATDAIAMGLNLPIKTILFARDNKFDGVSRRELTTTEVLQISGRAGRYGIEEHGFVGALDAGALRTINDRFHSSLPDIELPFSVMASIEHVILIGEILETDDLLEILSFFADNMKFDGPFEASNIDSMLEIASIVGEYDLELSSRFHLACAPVSIRSPYIESTFKRYISLLEKDKTVPYIPPRDMPPYAITNDELLNAEDRVKEVSLYLWLSFKFPDKFVQTQKAIEARVKLNRFIEVSLQKGDFSKTCKRCGKRLDFSYRFAVCDACHKRGQRTTDSRARGSYRRRGRRS